LYLHDNQGFEIKQITIGNFDVTEFYGYDPIRKLFYYQAAAESPLRREVYYVSADGKKKGKLSTWEGTNRADFSKGFNYYINYFSNLSSPTLVTLHNWQGKQIRVLESNETLKKLLTEYDIPTKEFFTFKTSDGVQLNGWLMKPTGFDPSKKYPVLMTQYSGPGSQEVLDSMSVSWNEYLAQEGFVIACVDPRGTGARGEDFRKVTYMQLGKYESDDLVEAAKYLAGLPFVDPKNMAIWGWSYGGFMTALTLSKGGELFKAGIAVAPVTNWRYYDNIYTERYMRTPEENKDGYDKNSPVFQADKIKSRLLLIHGSADDNVHLQNTMEYAEALVQTGVPFDMAIYTNRNHGIRGGNTTMHLYRKMTDFLKEQLMGK
jgi:dipeptidyl-peptidase 4